MADKYLNYTGLGYFYNRLKTLFAAVDDIPTKLSELENDGDGTQGSKYATESYVDLNGGKIDKIKVNGTEQTITNKEVDLNVVEGVANRNNTVDLSGGTGVGAWTAEVTTVTWVRGQGYQNATEVETAIDNALADITGIDFQVVQALPATGEKGVIYLLSNGGSQSDIYDEYIWIDGDPAGHFEKIGTTSVDLSDYWSKTELVAITTAEIDAIVEA